MVVFLIEIAQRSRRALAESAAADRLRLRRSSGPRSREGEWYRLVTSGFLHASLSTSASTCSLLFFLGRLLEPAIGTPRFVALYFASLLAGSFGALVLEPNALGLGASGAIFGLPAPPS